MLMATAASAATPSGKSLQRSCVQGLLTAIATEITCNVVKLFCTFFKNANRILDWTLSSRGRLFWERELQLTNLHQISFKGEILVPSKNNLYW